MMFSTSYYPMRSDHPHSNAIYRILEQPDGYRVEVSIPGTSPVMASGLPTLERAELWVATHQKRVEGGAPKKLTWRSVNRHLERGSSDR
jgi:hypothetical protein